MSNEIDYDLNIFQREYEVPDESLSDPSEGTVWEYREPWYIHIYQVNAYQGATMHEEYGEPIELTPTEANNLINNDPYFEDHEPDLWYGLNGFIADKDDMLSDRLRAIFYGLPTYAEEVLF
jgi:hypothetical protein